MRLLGKWTAAALAFCLFSAAADAGGPYVSRSTMFAIEKKLEAAVRGRWHDDPYMFVDLPRGYYVDNFGVIFVTEFSLAPGPGLSPFRGPISRQEIKQHKTTVLARVPELKDTMKAQLLEVAAALPAVPETDRVAIAVTVYHFDWEDTGDIPSQIIVQGD